LAEIEKAPLNLSKIGSERKSIRGATHVYLKAVENFLLIFSPIYSLIHAYVVEDIEKMLNAYWWGNNRTQSKDIRWMSWKRLSICKNDGVSKTIMLSIMLCSKFFFENYCQTKVVLSPYRSKINNIQRVIF
jgi:hypothetical protein